MRKILGYAAVIGAIYFLIEKYKAVKVAKINVIDNE
jgi:hypothetical protein